MSEPKSQMLNMGKDLSIPDPVTKNALVPFLNEKSLYALTWTCRGYRKQHKEYKEKHENVLADKEVAAKMLHCVLNPTEENQKQFLALLSTPKKDLNGLPLYLIPNDGEEVYFNSARQRKIKTIRKSTTVLEAVFRTKNFHLAAPMFKNIPDTEKTDILKTQITQLKAQEMWGMPELQMAYKHLNEHYDELFDAEEWNELDRRSGRIGQTQKEHLPWFSLYLFCHPVTHKDADYTKAPNWTCILRDNSVLDLDLFEPDSFYALYKGCCGAPWACWGDASVRASRRLDSTAFSSQCKVLVTEMEKTLIESGLDDPKASQSSKLGQG